MKTSSFLKLLAGCLVLASLSSCDFYGYQASLCGPSNSLDATAYSGKYQVNLTIMNEGKPQQFPPSAGTLTGTSTGALTLAMGGTEASQSAHFQLCRVGQKMILQAQGSEEESPAGYMAYDISPTQDGYDMRLFGFDPAQVQTKMPVKKYETQGSHEFPITTTTYSADNTQIAGPAFVEFLKPTDSLTIHLRR